jgi:hypothetical protein
VQPWLTGGALCGGSLEKQCAASLPRETAIDRLWTAEGRASMSALVHAVPWPLWRVNLAFSSSILILLQQRTQHLRAGRHQCKRARRPADHTTTTTTTLYVSSSRATVCLYRKYTVVPATVLILPNPQSSAHRLVASSPRRLSSSAVASSAAWPKGDPWREVAGH